MDWKAECDYWTGKAYENGRRAERAEAEVERLRTSITHERLLEMEQAFSDVYDEADELSVEASRWKALADRLAEALSDWAGPLGGPMYLTERGAAALAAYEEARRPITTTTSTDAPERINSQESDASERIEGTPA